MAKKKQLSSFYLYFLARLFVLIVLFLTVVNIDRIFSGRKVLGARIDTSSVLEQKTYYENLIDQNPTYIDGYLELAKIAATLGDRQLEKEYLDKAYRINPNYELLKQ